MNNKITLPRLVSLLAENSSTSKKICEDFLRNFFSVISETLKAGDQVKIKGIGTFKVTRVEARKSVNVSTGEEYTIPEHDKISFTPAKELAATVNSPFEIFETVELTDGITEEDLNNEIDPASLQTPEYDIAPSLETEQETTDIQEVYNHEVEVLKKDNDQIATDKPTVTEEPTAVVEPATVMESTRVKNPIKEEPAAEKESKIVKECAEDVEQEVKARNRHSFHKGFLWGAIAAVLAIALGLGATYAFLITDLTKIKEQAATAKTEQSTPAKTTPDTIKDKPADLQTTDTSSASSSDAVAEEIDSKETVADTKPSDTRKSENPAPKKVYDTITTTRYLGTMAKEHYGNYQFWSYIYEENKNFLGHPDRIRPGTRVVIPPLSKYGVDPSNPSDIDKARRKGAEIYARYSR